MRDALRLVVGTLTVVPVRPPARLDRRTGARAMVLAPLVGLLLGLLLVALLWLCRGLSPLVSATLAVALLAVLTRGLHLDGLADTADGLGSGGSAAEALAVMRRGDVGPFGVVSVVLVLLLQVAALGALSSHGGGPTPVVLALVTSRLALPLVCLRGVPAARADGLGSVVADSVSRMGLLVALVLALAAVAVADLVAGGLPMGSEGPALVHSGLSDGTATVLLRAGLAVVVPLLVAGALVLRCVRRLGGVTGDVLGACVEVTFTASLVLQSFR